MTWGRWYAAKRYMMSTLWLSPLVAFVLAQLTYRVPYVLDIDFGAIPGFIYTEQGRISALEINRESLRPHCYATTSSASSWACSLTGS